MVYTGITVWPLVVRSRVMEQMPFIASENMMMECVKAGGDRQEIHEQLRTHALESARGVKEEGKKPDLLDRIRSDDAFAAVHGRLDELLDPTQFIGRCPDQVLDFVCGTIDPLIRANKDMLSRVQTSRLKV